MSNLFEKIRKAEDLKREKIGIPEWDLEVVMTALTSREKIIVAEQMPSKDKDTTMVDQLELQYKIIALCLKDENGKTIIPIEKSDILASKNAEVVDRLIEVCNRVNGFDKKDNNVDTAEKN